MTGPLESRIRSKLIAALEPSHFEVTNESHMHSVPKDSETHFKVLLVSTKFEGLSRVARQRLVHEILSEELRGGVHALTQRALTPEEWERQGAEDFRSPNCHGGSKRS